MCTKVHPAHPDWGPCLSGIENHPTHHFVGPHGEEAILQNDDFVDIHQKTRVERNESLREVKTAVRDNRRELRAERRFMDEPGGRTGNRHPDTSHEAGEKTDARGQREKTARVLREATGGMTADAIQKLTGVRSPNQQATRNQELWEAGRAAVMRANGTCVFGVCKEHRPHPPDKDPHLPQDDCETHGKPLLGKTSTGRWAGLWVSLERDASVAVPAPAPAAPEAPRRIMAL